MSWGAPIWIYLWLAGMAGGAYFAAFLVDRFTGGNNKPLLKLATWLGIPLAVVGVLLLIVDLGQPLRFWHLLIEFKVASAMSMGTWILMVWVMVAVIMVVLWWFESRLGEETARSLRRLTGFLGWIDVVFAVLLMSYTGVLLAVSSQSLWAGTVLLPALFVASAISTGIAVLVIAVMATNVVELKVAVNQLFGSADWSISKKVGARLAEADAIVIVVELVALIGYAIWLATSSMAGAGDALGLLTTGRLAAPFWAGVVLLALLVPLGLDIASRGKEIEAKGVWLTVMASSACVILGGLVLRAVITIGGQL